MKKLCSIVFAACLTGCTAPTIISWRGVTNYHQMEVRPYAKASISPNNSQPHINAEKTTTTDMEAAVTTSSGTANNTPGQKDVNINGKAKPQQAEASGNQE